MKTPGHFDYLFLSRRPGFLFCGVTAMGPWTQQKIYEYIRQVGPENALTIALVGETSRQPFIGKLCVACVVRNRVRDIRRWPNRFEDVLCKKYHFSCFNEKLFRPLIVKPYWRELWWRECRSAAWLVVNDWVRDLTDGATHYWNPNICVPRWAPKVTWLAKIGDHQFAKE